jgi:hypothetical protein
MNIRKVVINGCYGGFGLSDEARAWLKERGVDTDDGDWDIPRDNPHLVELVETQPVPVNGMCARLYVVEIPADVQWVIEEHDGSEWVAEKHRTWG